MIKKEFHWFETYPSEEYFDHNIYSSLFSTKEALLRNEPIIYSTQSAFFSQETMDRGYTLVAHLCGQPPIYIDRGETLPTGRLVTKKQNLEKLLLAGEFNYD